MLPDKNTFSSEIKQEYKQINETYLAKKPKEYASYKEIQTNKIVLDFNSVAKAKFVGKKVFIDYSLKEISKYINWTFFFHAWEFKGVYPKIFESKEKGKEAKKLFDDAQQMLEKIISEKWFSANAIIGIYKANSVENSIELYDNKNSTVATFNFLRQQEKKSKHLCLADFIEIDDYIGAFVTSVGFGMNKKIEEFRANNDEYSIILMQSLADRLAEAFAELMHARVRTEFWAYTNDENLTKEDILKEKFQGIRPAFGYPACPDHSDKKILWNLLNVEEEIGTILTENFSMSPVSSISGLYFAHKDARYFGIGKILKDQIQFYVHYFVSSQARFVAKN